MNLESNRNKETAHKAETVDVQPEPESDEKINDEESESEKIHYDETAFTHKPRIRKPYMNYYIFKA